MSGMFAKDHKTYGRGSLENPPVHFGTSVGMAPRMGISETGFALQENPIKRPWEDLKTGAKGATVSMLEELM